ncbi:unnamed protein product [marine sediment metagenome]|uniref:Glycosyltransferase 2-like domain-containing protein n=1 Tax=marine sediment metagenome TaxID=412755 RepID=X1KMF9_9ZZZZ
MSPVLDLIKNYWTKNIQKADQEFFKRNLNGRYISHIGTGNFAIRSSTMKRLMFDSNTEGLEDFELCLRLKGIAKIRFFPTIKVGHHHPSSFQKYVKNSFQRGYWVKKIFEKHKKNIDIEKEPMFESLSFKNFLFFPFWMILQFIKRPIGEAYFTLVSEVSWRAGILWAILF